MKQRQDNILYIDPMVDFGFKRIFKDSGKKQLIIRPLNMQSSQVCPGISSVMGYVYILSNGYGNV